MRIAPICVAWTRSDDTGEAVQNGGYFAADQ
jgi:hypothetical protein